MESMSLVGIEAWKILNIHMRRGHIETTTNGQSVAIWAPDLLQAVFGLWMTLEREIRQKEDEYNHWLGRTEGNAQDRFQLEQEKREKIAKFKSNADNEISILVHKWLLDNASKLRVELGQKGSPHALNIWVK